MKKMPLPAALQFLEFALQRREFKIAAHDAAFGVDEDITWHVAHAEPLGDGRLEGTSGAYHLAGCGVVEEAVLELFAVFVQADYDELCAAGCGAVGWCCSPTKRKERR